LCQLLATSGHLPLVIFVPVRNAVLLLRPVLVTTTAFPPRSTATVWDVSEEGYPLLIDPVTGDPRLGGSSSGREAARVVKFSPEGSSRDLMVFSEENSNIHIIDARTFHTHVILPVPADQAASTSAIPAGGQSSRSGVEGGTWGIAGVAFDPSGDWLYSGTERTVVEWDMRRCGGGGEAGTWQMA
jgi:WD40 repeat protein